MEKVLVTGGSGFIGSHLVDRLIENYEVTVLDDLSAGSFGNIKGLVDNGRIKFIKGTILSDNDLDEAMDSVTTIYHLAAQPDVRLSVERPFFDFEVNMIGGMKVLEALRRNDVKRLVFASSGGTVYGDTDKFPTPESTAFQPISN